MIRSARAMVALAALGSVAHANEVLAPPPTLPVTTERLANGLGVILAPDPSASTVVVHVRYHSGAADETPAEAGFAHLVERLMFAGTTHVKDFDGTLEAAGGWSTSATAADHITLAEQVPAAALELALWLEAERMAGLADAITDTAIANERRAIANERRSAYEDHPYALVARAVQQALWAGDGYAHLVLTEPTGTRAAVIEFVRAHVIPANATLVICGRFEVAAASALVQRYFGGISGRARIEREPVELAPLAKSVELAVADPVPKVVVAFRAGRPFAADAIALEVAARILSVRLEHRLVDGTAPSFGGGASEVSAEIVRQTRGDELRVQASARPDVDPASLAIAIRAEVARLGDAAVDTDELARASTALELQLVIALDNLVYRAEALAAWRLYAPYDFDAIRGNLHAVTPDVLRRAASYWLGAAVTVIGRPR